MSWEGGAGTGSLMRDRLIGWARAVKRRHHIYRDARFPPLWLFTDAARLPDPLPAVARLPAGLAGVVFRHDGVPGRAALGRALARLCRERRLALVVAGDARLAAALGAGVHLRAGRFPGAVRPKRGVRTASAHSVAELRRAAAAGADLAFLSPAFPTQSHAGAPALGPLRWAAIARHAGGMGVGALGGVAMPGLRRLPARRCVAAGAIAGLV